MVQGLAKSLSRSEGSAVSLDCYTNVLGDSDAYQDSQDMADSVAQYLESLGISGKRIFAFGRGNPSYDDMDALPRDEDKVDRQERYCDFAVTDISAESEKKK